jgi:hypothetical protein
MSKKEKDAFAQLNKDFNYLLEMRQSYANAVKKFEDDDDVEPAPYMAIENAMLGLDIVITNLSKLIYFAKALDEKEPKNDRIN